MTVRGWGRRLRHAPVSLALAVVSLVMMVVGEQLSTPGPDEIGSVSRQSELRFDPDTIRLSRIGLELLAPATVPALIIVLAVLVTLGPLIERHLGSWRYGLTLLGCHLAGFLFTTVLTWLIHPWWPDWATIMREGWVSGSFPAFMGVLMAASGGLSRLWCSRVRWAGLAVAVTLMLYDATSTTCVMCGSMLAGLALGALLWRGRRRTGIRPVLSERRVLLAVVVACTSIGPIVSAWSAAVESPLNQFSDYLRTGSFESSELRVICSLASQHACVLARLHKTAGLPTLFMTVLPSLILLVVCVGLLRGRRSAWFWALGVNIAMGATTALPFLEGLSDLAEMWAESDQVGGVRLALRVTVGFLPALEPVVVIIVLLACSRLFTVRLTHEQVARRLVRYLGLYLAGMIVFVVAGLLVADQWEPTAQFGDLAHDALARVLGLEVFAGMPLVLTAHSLPAGLVANLIPPMTTLIFLVILLRDMTTGPALAGRDRARIRELVREGKGGLISWMAAWPGAIHWFDATRSSAVAYRASHGVALTVGEPISDEPMRTAVEFSAACDEQGLTPCFYSVGPDFAQSARAAGWHAMQIAEESRFELGEIAFKGKRFQDVRTAMNRARREGISVEWTSLPQCSARQRCRIARVVEGWQDGQALPPMGFTLGGLAEMDDPAVRCEIAIDEAGHVHAVASWLPLYTAGEVTGWLLDVMRRSDHPEAFHSGMELLIGTAILTFQDEGYSMVSLSGSPLARAERENEPVEDQVSETITGFIDQLATAVEPYYSFTSLHRFKSKFGPAHQPLYLVYADPSQLPAIGGALTTAYLSDTDRVDWRTVITRMIRTRRSAGERNS